MAEQIEEVEAAPADSYRAAVPSQPDADERGARRLDDVIDAGTSGPGEPGSSADSQG